MFQRIVRSDNLRVAVMEEIKRLIGEETLQAGDKLPPERDMAEQFNVSRTVIRDAIKMLAGVGILDVKHGSGIFVATVDREQLIEQMSMLLLLEPGSIQNLFDVRMVLETAGVRWAAKRASLEQCVELSAIVEKAEAVVQANGDITHEQLPRLGELDSTFHLQIAVCSQNPVLQLLMKNLLELLEASRMHSLEIPSRPNRSVAEHRKIVEAICDHEEEAAQAAMQSHLQSVFHSMLEYGKGK